MQCFCFAVELERRVDFELREGLVESRYWSTVTSHTGYWCSLDIALFLLTFIYKQKSTSSAPAEDTPEPDWGNTWLTFVVGTNTHLDGGVWHWRHFFLKDSKWLCSKIFHPFKLPTLKNEFPLFICDPGLYWTHDWETDLKRPSKICIFASSC